MTRSDMPSRKTLSLKHGMELDLLLKSCHYKKPKASEAVKKFKKDGYFAAKVYKVPNKEVWCVYARKTIGKSSPTTKPNPKKSTPKTKLPKPKTTGTSKARGCKDLSKLKKYRTRPSPSYPANECCGSKRRGNDGNLWESKPNSRGICTWRKIR